MKQTLRVMATLVIMAFVSNTGTAFSMSYFGFDAFDDKWYDAEKTLSNDKDNYMCWAAASANILSYTGWGVAAGNGFTSEDAIFQYFQDHWTDQGGTPYYGINWWFNGINPAVGTDDWSQVDVSGGGFFKDANIDLLDYYTWTTDNGKALEMIGEYLLAGYGVTLSLSNGTLGHAVTVWGYDYDDDNSGSYLGIHITDSDNSKNTDTPPDLLSYYNVSMQDNTWYLENFYGTDSWYIEDVQALAQIPDDLLQTLTDTSQQVAVPLPGTLWLLGITLLTAVGRHRNLGRQKKQISIS